MSDTLTAAKVLDAIAAKYDTSVLLRELVLADPAHNVLVDEWLAAGGPESSIPFPVGACRRIDALMLEGGTRRTAIEVKVSRSDFLRETPEKRAVWESVTDRFVYACPSGLIQPGEIPPHCGLWWIGPDQSVTVKSRARKNRTVQPLPHQITVTLAYRLKNAQTALRRSTRLSA